MYQGTALNGVDKYDKGTMQLILKELRVEGERRGNSQL